MSVGMIGDRILLCYEGVLGGRSLVVNVLICSGHTQLRLVPQLSALQKGTFVKQAKWGINYGTSIVVEIVQF